jgi:hypothetical protein
MFRKPSRNRLLLVKNSTNFLAMYAYDISSSHLVRIFGHMFFIEFGVTFWTDRESKKMLITNVKPL